MVVSYATLTILSSRRNARVVETCQAAPFQFGKDTALVAVQHMLDQTVDLFQTVAGMGLSLHNIFALGKVYSNSRPVIETLRQSGVTVIESTLPEPENSISTSRKTLKGSGKSLLDTHAS